VGIVSSTLRAGSAGGVAAPKARLAAAIESARAARAFRLVRLVNRETSRSPPLLMPSFAVADLSRKQAGRRKVARPRSRIAVGLKTFA